MRNTMIVAVLGLGLVLGAGCKSPVDDHSDHEHGMESGSEHATEAAVVNDECPMMGGAVEAGIEVDFKGKMVGFCCADCVPAWQGLSEEEKEAKLAGVAGG